MVGYGSLAAVAAYGASRDGKVDEDTWEAYIPKFLLLMGAVALFTCSAYLMCGPCTAALALFRSFRSSLIP